MIKNNFAKLKKEIYEHAIINDKNPFDIKILAVTKTFPIEIILKAIEAGIEYLGESRVQESIEKIPSLYGKYKEFHFIGHLQTNKINKILTLKPTLIHSIDKYSTAFELNNCLKNLNRTQDILVEVNTSGESSKLGVSPQECADLIKKINDLEFIRIKGLMTIGANSTDENIVKKCFGTLRELFEKEKNNLHDNVQMKYLSMGMSGDYKIAIETGSNLLRIGSAIFGGR